MVSVMLRHGLVPPSSFEERQNFAPTNSGYKEWSEKNVAETEKECWLSQASHAIQSSQLKLELLSTDFQHLCTLLASSGNSGETEADKANKNEKAKSPLAVLSQNMTLITSQMLEMSRPLFDTTMGLYSMENFFRNTDDLSELEFSSKGRIRLPPFKVNETVIMGLNFCRTKAEEAYISFKEAHPTELKMIEILQLMVMATEDFQLGAHKTCVVFENILYLDEDGKKFLQTYGQAIGFLERSDIIMESQALRRSIDEIMILLERMSLVSFLTFSKIAGNYEYVSSLNENPMKMDAKLIPICEESEIETEPLPELEPLVKKELSTSSSKSNTIEFLAPVTSQKMKKVALKGKTFTVSKPRSHAGSSGSSKSRSSSQTKKKVTSKKK